MSPPFWTTPTERAFLEPWMPVYLTLKAEGKIHLFGPQLYEAWFKEFPEHRALDLPLPNARDGRALTQDELATWPPQFKPRRRKKIGNATTTAPVRNFTHGMRAMFKGRVKKRRRAHQPIEIFQKRNTDTIREKLAEEGYNELNEEKMADDKRTKAERMRVRTRVVQALWAEASTEERAAVEAEAEENPDERTPRQYQDGIDVLEPFLGEAHKAIKDEAGWVGLTITGGPNPRLNGGLSYKIVSFGNVAEPFEAFLRARFSVAERQARALPKQDSGTDEPRLPSHGQTEEEKIGNRSSASAGTPAAIPIEPTTSDASGPTSPPPTSSEPVMPAASESDSGYSSDVLSEVGDSAINDPFDSNSFGDDDGDAYLPGGDFAPASDVAPPPAWTSDYGLPEWDHRQALAQRLR
ncbi:hypothetical protein B0H13DRAFT_2409619 [Mycena leptocephala]|nr:hypothetical protein B0H13DRAFT_2409619 [Mycena leptocephala]